MKSTDMRCEENAGILMISHSGQRKVRKMTNIEKSIAKILEETVEEICFKYCKWPYLWDEEAEGIELCESDICKNCPLNRLV